MDPSPRRAALYLDFDNVFSGLALRDEWAAWRFAAEPWRWLSWLAAGADGGGARRILVRRCYLNPAGWTEPTAGGGLAQWLGQPRLYYSRFRAEFVRAGVQVIDCPRLARLKNGADIQMALDVAEAMAHPTRFEEFILLSGDSDFTPLLHRLREHDRRTLLVAHDASAQALRAAADTVIALEDFAEDALEAVAPAQPRAAAGSAPGAVAAPAPDLARPVPREPVPGRHATTDAAPGRPAGAEPEASRPAAPDPVPDPVDPLAQREVILAALRHWLAAAPQPLHLPAIGKRVHVALGAWVRRGRFGGAGTLAKLIEDAPDLALEAGPGGGWLYDPSRHERPSMEQPEIGGLAPEEAPAAPPALRSALGPGQAPPRLAAEALDFGLRGLAGLLPLPGPPEPGARAALAAEAAAAGLDLPPRELDTLVSWLSRARFDWAAPAGEMPRDRLARALFAALTRQVAAGGARLPRDAIEAVREWVGLAPRGEAPEERQEERQGERGEQHGLGAAPGTSQGAPAED